MNKYILSVLESSERTHIPKSGNTHSTFSQSIISESIHRHARVQPPIDASITSLSQCVASLISIYFKYGLQLYQSVTVPAKVPVTIQRAPHPPI